MQLVTSNDKKLEEFKRILPEMTAKKGLDLKEVLGTHEEVIIYKALEAGKDCVVEDTILNIDGEDIVDIKWKLKELTTKESKAVWNVLLAYNNGTEIELYKGIVRGTINPDSTDTGYAFDPFFIPNFSDGLSLGALEDQGRKDDFSARRNGLVNLKNGNIFKSIKIADIKPWEGAYQND